MNDEEQEEELPEEDNKEWSDPKIEIDGNDMTKGAKLTMTFNEGLVVQVQPNGDIIQKGVTTNPMPKSETKGNQFVQDQLPDHLVETQRLITTDSQIVKYMADGNFIIYFPDGSLTYSDKRKGTWYTINSKGVKRTRRLADGMVTDEKTRLKITTKIDPETNATLKIREDGVLQVEYID
jgi:hypothetical protein